MLHRSFQRFMSYVIWYYCSNSREIHFLIFEINILFLQDLVVRLTEDSDPFFLYNLVISEEDFQR